MQLIKSKFGVLPLILWALKIGIDLKILQRHPFCFATSVTLIVANFTPALDRIRNRFRGELPGYISYNMYGNVEYVQV